MNGLGGLNKSPEGVVIGLVQLQLPTVVTKADCDKAGGKFVEAVGENAYSGDYPLALPLRIVFRRESAAALRPLLRFLFSDGFTPVLERASLVPLATTARRQQTAALEKN